MRPRLAWAPIGALVAAAGCGPAATPKALITVGADGDVAQYDLYVRDDAQKWPLLLHTGWSDATKGGAKKLSTDPLKIGLTLPHPGSYSVVIVGAIGPTKGVAVDFSNPNAFPPPQQFFWAATFDAENDLKIDAHLYTVMPTEDKDGDAFPSASWAHAASVSAGLLDCDDDKAAGPNGTIQPAEIFPFAQEVCGDGVDENCDGDGDETCVDSDGDGDPDTSDCKPNDPKIHHPTMKDPFPESPNCCGYNLGMTGAAAGMDFSSNALCHAGSCGDGIDQDCNGVDTPCTHDQDCDSYPAASGQPMGCTAPVNDPPGTDCNDCDPSIHPGAAEICGDNIDQNCFGGPDETCVSCDLDGDTFERMDPSNNPPCPDNKDMNPGKVDCNDYDRGVYPGSTGAQLPFLGGVSCNGVEGPASVACALRGACRALNPDTSPQDADCSGSPHTGCPPANCDADGDGFVVNMNGCGNGPFDCNDDPTPDPMNHNLPKGALYFPGAPAPCGETVAPFHNCSAPVACGADKDGDGWDANNDCNDNDPAVHPWAIEVCNGTDDDCDGLIDEGNPDETGAPLVEGTAITSCNDSGYGSCAPTTGKCVCSSNSIMNQHFDFMTTPPRKTCPGETLSIDMGGEAAMPRARCYGAPQPGLQTCNTDGKHDEDCDGRFDAPDGKNLAELGKPCWPAAVGQCAPTQGGKITACAMGSSNCFGAFGVNPWYVCDNTAICPKAEICNGFDDDCNGSLPSDEADADNDGYMACAPCVPPTSGKQCGDCNDGVKSIHPSAPEICDGIDQDCDGTKDDNLTDCPGAPPGMICCGGAGCKNSGSDVQNCGMCGKVCSLANATPVCSGGSCAIGSCNGGFADCDTAASNGCEINLTNDPNHCGACGTVCSSNNIASPSCAGSTCNGNCNGGFADCNNNKQPDGCEINVTSDPSHCGGCGNVCSNNNMATVTCGGSVCNGSCNGGFADCDSNKLSNGCEINLTNDPNHCGACGNLCSGNNMASRTCGGSNCNGNCAGGFADCNGNKLSDGCEINLTNDANNCGNCGTACSANHMATRTCGGSSCNGTCSGGFADCNGNKQSDGCETQVNGSDVNNCGGCGTVCSSNHITQSCSGGACNGACNAGFGDCNGNKQSDGCETQVNGNDVNNCGGCGVVCSSNHITQSCSGGTCNGGCNAGYADCDGNKQSDGCEVLVNGNDVNNCGGCGIVCSANHITQSCSGGACNGACNAGFGDCDGNKQSNGCETNTSNDVNNCGGCGTVCSSNHITQSCSGSNCNGACNAGFGDCDGNKQSNGCETNTTNDVNNCGGCGTVCSANHITQSCSGSACNGACAAGYSDCNGNKQSDGCETHTAVDVNNCGGCGVVCSSNHITQSCSAGACNGACNAGFADCDGNKQTNGCEIQLGTTTNCSACGDDCTNAANGHICYMNTMCGCAMDTDCLSGHTCNMGNHRCN